MSLQVALSAEIGRALGHPFQAESAREASGGCIHRALVLEGNGERCFVKLNAAEALPMFEAEQDGLAALAATCAFRVPRPLCCGVADGQAYLALEYLPLDPVTERSGAIACGRALAALHRTIGKRYGWHRDNFIGATPQANAENDSWARFFAEARLRPQLARAAAQAPSLRKKGKAWRKSCRPSFSTTGLRRACCTATSGTATRQCAGARRPSSIRPCTTATARQTWR